MQVSKILTSVFFLHLATAGPAASPDIGIIAHRQDSVGRRQCDRWVSASDLPHDIIKLIKK